MAAISSSLFCVEDRPPLLLGLQVDEVFGVEEAGGVGAVVGPPHLADTTCVTSGNEARMTRAWFITRAPSVGPVLGASVPRTQMAPSSRCGRNSEPMMPLVGQIAPKRQRSQRHRRP